LGVTLDDRDIVTGLVINRLEDTDFDIPSPEYDRLRKWVPDEAWAMPDYAMPLFQRGDERWIAAIKLGEPIAYKKIED
jgi:hypothetical protein